MGSMPRGVAELTVEEFRVLVERTIDGRFEVWLTQLMDAFEGLSDENGDELRPEFAASLRRSLEQARSGEGSPLNTIRPEVGAQVSSMRSRRVDASRSGVKVDPDVAVPQS
jgi:hypothetical protein